LALQPFVINGIHVEEVEQYKWEQCLIIS